MAPSAHSKLSYTASCMCCKVCGGPEEEKKRFLICGHSLCTYKYYHISCLNSEQIASDVQMGNPCWYCPSCLCRVCLCDMDDNKIILCDRCDEGYHLYCLSPPRTSVPKGRWECALCIEGKKKEREMAKYEKTILILHRKDHDADILRCNRFHGVNLLLSAAKKLKADATKKKKPEKSRLGVVCHEPANATENKQDERELADLYLESGSG